MQDFISKAPLVVELRADRPSLVPGVQRLRSIDFERVMEIQDTLSAAQSKADDIVQRAVDVQEQARVDGRAEGRLEVRQELLRAVTDMQATLQHWVLQTEPQLIDMVLRCVREVVKETNPDSLVRGSIGRALTEMSTATDIRIQVHESQLASLRSEIEALTEQYALEGAIRIEGTPALKPGDCIVESPLGTVDLRIETQLKFVDQTLKQD